MQKYTLVMFLFAWMITSDTFCQSRALVFQTDFGLKDGAVSAMKGVAYSVSTDLHQYDLTHEIPAYNIWEAAYRLNQAAPYWPSGTVFVSVVDPGVGSARKSIVAKTSTGHFIVTPDNGTLTLISETMGILEVREIDETVNRLKNSEQSYTFHGRDVYAYTGAKLAAGVITFEQVGKKMDTEIIKLPYEKPTFANGIVKGNIDILDIQYGNVWTNISQTLFQKLGAATGARVNVSIKKDGKVIYSARVLYGKTFSDVKVGEPIAYINSLLNFALALNQQSFSDRYKVHSGPGWTIELSK
jgi:S-adenosylmethionine hydrolase